jgi:phenylalanyl-tRNA synthetase beta chain
MIVTRKWLEEFVDISNISTDEICVALNSIGLEVDSVTKPNIAKGVKVGYVESKEKHPDADKLNVCQVNLGDEKVQIVCGAKNVDAGQYVPVATVGTTLGEDFKIKKAKLRGVDSHGMICSSTEIGLAKLNDGILELDDSIGELIIGKELSEYDLVDDEVIEIELTANRGDCLNIRGVAKELCVYFNLPLIESEPEIEEDSRAIGRILDIDYSNEVDASLLYKVADIADIKVPLINKLRVATVGVEKKSDIETLVAYCIHTTGVILNVYTKAIAQNDKEEINLTIRRDKDGFTQIGGNIPLSTIGIETGYISKPDDTIVVEASYTNPDLLAQKVFKSKQKTGEVYYKSSRGSNSDLEFGIDYLCCKLSSLGGSIYKGSMNFVSDIPERSIDININTINKIIGEDIPTRKIENILTSLGFVQSKVSNDVITSIIPNTRHDIVNIADVTEEIVRMVGIDNIRSKPLAIEEVNRTNNISNNLVKKNKIRAASIAQNFFETTTYVFSSRELLEQYGFDVVADKKDILNPITSDLNTFRTTLLLNLVQAVSANTKQGFKSIALFESGTVFDAKRDESSKLGYIFSGTTEDDNLSNGGKPENIDLFGFASKLVNIIGEFELDQKTNFPNKFLHPYQSANIMQNGKCIGIVSKLHPNVSKDFDISDATFIAEIDFDLLTNDLTKAQDISKYQSSKRDLSFVVPKSVEYKEIKKVINSLKIKELVQFNLIDLYHDEALGDNESLTLKFVLQSDTKTLEEEDITSIMDKIIESLKDKLNLELR